MRNVLFLIIGAVLCIVLQTGYSIYSSSSRSQGEFINVDCPSVEVTSTSNKADQTYLIRKGETHAIPSGEYRVTVYEGKGSFLLDENAHGVCKILWESSETSPQGFFDVAVNPNASVSRLSENGSVSGL